MGKIKISEDGPYMVENLQKLTDSNDTEFENKEMIALCRCGASKSKPFCDGSHTDTGFSGKKEREEKFETNEFKGKQITVLDNSGVCCHAGECVSGSPEVFFSRKEGKRISNPDNGDKENIVQTIRKCPSGALTYKIDNELFDEYFSDEEIFISKDGPLHVRGGVDLDDGSKDELNSKKHYTLCRCGASNNKPFCDGIHKMINFNGD